MKPGRYVSSSGGRFCRDEQGAWFFADMLPCREDISAKMDEYVTQGWLVPEKEEPPPDQVVFGIRKEELWHWTVTS